MYAIECRKCGATMAYIEHGKFIAADRARITEIDQNGNTHYVCKDCGCRKIYRPDKMSAFAE